MRTLRFIWICLKACWPLAPRPSLTWSQAWEEAKRRASLLVVQNERGISIKWSIPEVMIVRNDREIVRVMGKVEKFVCESIWKFRGCEEKFNYKSSADIRKDLLSGKLESWKSHEAQGSKCGDPLTVKPPSTTSKYVDDKVSKAIIYNICKNYKIPCPFAFASENAPIPCWGNQEQCDNWRKDAGDR